MREVRPSARACAGLAALGCLVSVVAALCGIGGGLFVIPVLHYGFKLSLKRSIATALGLVAATTTAATLAEAVHPDSALNGYVVAALLSGGLVGAELGFRVATRVSPRSLKLVFIFVLSLAAFRILSAGESAEGGAGAQLLPGFEQLLGFGAVGVAAGFTSPLLGIGGGMVSVPALFLGFPELGYLGARACAMALGSVASLRSLWLYHREGVVETRLACSLGAGALAGAVLGVQLVHLEGASRVGQVFLACLLVLIAVRFTLDVWRARPEAEVEAKANMEKNDE